MSEKPYHDAELLRALYWGQGWSMGKIAEKFDVDGTTIRNWMVKNGTPRRGGGEAAGEARRVEWATHIVDNYSYERWRDQISGDRLGVHELLAIADGADPHKVFADGTACHHGSGHPRDNRPENIEVLDHGEHTSHHNNAGIPECKHRVLQSATIMAEARA